MSSCARHKTAVWQTVQNHRMLRLLHKHRNPALLSRDRNGAVRERTAPLLWRLRNIPDSAETLSEHFRIHAHADAEVIRHAEETARDHRRLMVRAQAHQEPV